MVEDDADLRELQALILRMQGYLVFEASDGLEALNVLRRVQPDLILLDLQMPGMTGWQFLERLRSKPVRVPICVLSAEPVDSSLDMDAVLRKPVLAPVLLDTVRQLCQPSVQLLRSLKR